MALTIEGVDLELVSNVSDEQVAANVAEALALGLPELQELPATRSPLSIVGGGPSLRQTLPEIQARYANGQTIWALNGAHDWLIANGVIPEAAWLVDSRADNVRFFRKPDHRVLYYIASRCHPLVFRALKGYAVTLWHCFNCATVLPPGAKTLIGGGTTVGGKAMAAAFALGYRDMHLYGFDSSYADETHHAYPQPMNDGEEVIDVTVAGRTFKSTAWMLGQVKSFGLYAPMLAEEGCEIHAHGDGLLQWTARAMMQPAELAA